MFNKSMDKYLLNYAEIESQDIAVVSSNYDYVVVIPICNEDDECLASIFSNIDKTQSVLIVLVVNSPIDNPQSPLWMENNKIFIQKLIKNSSSDTTLYNNCQLLKTANFFDIILVNRNSKGQQIKANHGVGLARKIGSDIALKYYYAGKIKYPWIFSTDADVVLPGHYFFQVGQFNPSSSAIVLDFEHYSDDEHLSKLQFYYDFKIRYYHAGITFAGSSYDYIPLGSTLIASMLCYAQVRGFPKKNAGEDFYLLNKLAKIKSVSYCNVDSVVKIKSRFSNRVPFGTGPALLKINALVDINQYKYYHPKCFILLKKWLHFLHNMWKNNQLNIKSPNDGSISALYDYLGCNNTFEKCKHQITSKTRWTQFVHQWFDAFKTLKAVHYFNKNIKPLNYQQLLKSHAFAKVVNLKLKDFINKNDKI